jgi:ribose 5-phosphate isomerase
MNILKQVNNMTKETKMVNTAEEVEQIEKSALVACDFIYDTLLPLLDEFENDNDDPEYIPGIATHGLFVALIQELADLGYTQKDLNKEIKTYMNSSLGEVVH